MIDSHVHLDDQAFDEDRDSLIKSLGDNGIELVINNSSDLPSSERSVELANKYENIYAVSYTHLTLPTKPMMCRSRWSPYH